MKFLAMIVAMLFAVPALGDATAQGKATSGSIVVQQDDPRPPFAVYGGYASGWALDGVGLEDSTQMNGLALGAAWKPVREGMTRDFAIAVDAAWLTSNVSDMRFSNDSNDFDGGCASTDCGRGNLGTLSLETLNLTTYFASVRWDAAPILFGRELGDRLDLYGIAGVGGMSWRGGAIDDFDTLAGSFGVGTSFLVTDRIGAMAEANYLLPQDGSGVVLSKLMLVVAF